MMKTSVLAFALVTIIMIVEAKSIGESNDRILGAERSVAGLIPYTVSVSQYVAPEQFANFCGGVLISDRIVLTAAYCTQDKYSNPDYIIVSVGAFVLNQEVCTDHKVAKITNHPEYNARTHLNDISVIKTIDNIYFSFTVQPAKLPTSNVATGAEVMVSGWGRVNVSRLRRACVFCFLNRNLQIKIFVFLFLLCIEFFNTTRVI